MRRTGPAIAALAAVSLLATASAASAYRTRDGMIARSDPAAQGVFEVFKKPGAGPSEYWCAAGDYAMRGLSLSGSTRLYVARGLGRSTIDPRRTSVRFTYVNIPEVAAAAQGMQGNSLSITKVGASVPAAHGRSLCGQRSDRRGRG